MSASENNKISVLIITLNEENNMRSLLSDLDFADEVIVVDSLSTDKTAEICRSFDKATFIEHPFENYSSQRNFAISQAKNNWILFLDADERLTPNLKQEILATVQDSNSSCDAYYFYRTFMFKNTPLNFSGLQTDKNIRLFQNGKAFYSSNKLVHEKLNVKGEIGFLKNKLIHYSYANYESYKAKAIRYGELKAMEKFQKGIRPNFLLQYLHPVYNFLYNYLIRLGFLDGKKGIIICALNAYSILIRYKKLTQLRNKS